MDMSFESFDQAMPVTPFLVGISSIAAAGTLSPPTGFQSGDLAVLYICIGGTSTPHALPSGWTDDGSDFETNEATGRLCHKTGPADVTISGTDVCAVMAVFRGQGTLPTTFASIANAANSSATPSVPGLTPTGTANFAGAHFCGVGPGGAGYGTARTPAATSSPREMRRALDLYVSRTGAAIFPSVGYHIHGTAGNTWVAYGPQVHLSGTVSDRVGFNFYIPGNGAA